MQDDRDLYEAVENIYALDPPQRRLFTLANILPRSLSSTCIAGCRADRTPALFDNADDTLTFQRIQCFDFEGSRTSRWSSSRCCSTCSTAPARRFGDARAGSQLKLFVLDEAWRFAQDATVKAYITEALKTWRKRNAADAPRHAEQRGLRRSRPAAHGRRELSDEVLPGQSRHGSRPAPATCSTSTRPKRSASASCSRAGRRS